MPAMAMTDTAGRFVWVKDRFGRLWPERWTSNPPDTWMRDHNVVTLYYLDREQMTWPLSQLERAFPAPTGPSASVDRHHRAAAVSAK